MDFAESLIGAALEFFLMCMGLMHYIQDLLKAASSLPHPLG